MQARYSRVKIFKILLMKKIYKPEFKVRVPKMSQDLSLGVSARTARQMTWSSPPCSRSTKKGFKSLKDSEWLVGNPESSSVHKRSPRSKFFGLSLSNARLVHFEMYV